MSLDPKRLELARQLASGVVQARCPACAKSGSDKAGEHLRVYPDGRFGCCVYPKDREHRKQIFALAGDRPARSDRSFKVRATAAKQPAPPPQSVTASLTSFLGTLGTAFFKSQSESGKAEQNIGTLGTAIFKSRAYRKEESTYMCKDMKTGVPSVPKGETLPYFTPGGNLVIPFDGPERYHWWKSGQSVAQTRQEVLERMKDHGTTV